MTWTYFLWIPGFLLVLWNWFYVFRQWRRTHERFLHAVDLIGEAGRHDLFIAALDYEPQKRSLREELRP